MKFSSRSRKSPLFGAFVGAVACAFLLALQPAHAQSKSPTPAWLTCPDAATIDLRPDPDRDPARIREIRPTAGAMSSIEVYSHARLASLAYDLYAVFDAGADPRTAFNEPGLTLTSLIYGVPGKNTERGPRAGRTRTLYGFIADEKSSGRRYFVFRGTQVPAEWVRNVQAGQRPYPSGATANTAQARVHAGFLQIFETLSVENAAGTAAPFATALPGLVADRNTVFVGHSLGSALATLAGVEAGRRAPQEASRIRVVTLASPRVGDAGFAAMAARLGRIDRVCNLVDVVTAVPPSTRNISYVHVGTPFRVSSFDWATLANDLPKAGDQILCWHSDLAYAAMLNPAHKKREPAQCFKR